MDYTPFLRNENFWYMVYRILIEECGAYDSESEHSNFTYQMAKNNVVEYRFQGKLGFGGKLWNNDRADGRCRIYVNYYKEDETEERNKIEKKTNERLEKFFKWYTTRPMYEVSFAGE